MLFRSERSARAKLRWKAVAQELMAQEERSARAKLRWKAVAQEIMARRRGGGGGARRRKACFSYDSKSYALNFDQGAAAE